MRLSTDKRNDDRRELPQELLDAVEDAKASHRATQEAIHDANGSGPALAEAARRAGLGRDAVPEDAEGKPR